MKIDRASARCWLLAARWGLLLAAVCLVTLLGPHRSSLAANLGAIWVLKSDAYLTGRVPDYIAAGRKANQYATWVQRGAGYSRWLWRLYFWGGDYSHATEVFLHSVAQREPLWTWDTRWLFMEGRMLRDMEYYDEAERAFLIAASVGMDPATAYYEAGRVRDSVRDQEGARQFYRLGIEAGTERMAEGYFLLGYSYYQNGDRQKPISLWQIALDSATRYGGLKDYQKMSALVHLGQMYLSRGEVDLAQESFEQALEFDPDGHTSTGRKWATCFAYLGRGDALQAQGDMVDARAAYVSSLAYCLRPAQNAEARIRLANVLYLTGDAPQAQRVLLQATTDGIADADHLVRLGDAFAQVGLAREALDAYRRALVFDPVHPGALKGIEDSK